MRLGLRNIFEKWNAAATAAALLGEFDAFDVSAGDAELLLLLLFLFNGVADDGECMVNGWLELGKLSPFGLDNAEPVDVCDRVEVDKVVAAEWWDTLDFNVS